MDARPLEITDLLWRTDADGVPVPVVKADVVHALQARGQRRAARIASKLPAAGEVLDPAHVDALGLRVHRELQRLGEELQLGRRVAARLRPVVEAVRRGGAGQVRVVDVGCGLGFVVREMAASRALGPGVELAGVDLNPVLVAEARRLAELEGLACRFTHGDAFRPGLAVDDGGCTIIISTGLLHHLPERGLPEFFAAQARLGVVAFAHWDIAPCLWSTAGAWVFHRARMREAVSRHDGVLSARRAHGAPVLEAAARTGAPGYDVRVLEGSRWHPAALDVLAALAAYVTLKWELRYLASALILGPLTLLRPGVAVLGAALAIALARDAAVASAAALSVIAVLSVEPLAGRLWYTPDRPRT